MENIKIQVEKVIRDAGKIFIDTVMDESLVHKKGHQNFVTEVDFRVQDYLMNALLKILPESNFIAEESSSNQYHLEKPTWVVDPVDGTTNLMHQFQHSAISVALYLDKEPSLGYIYNPTSGEMFFAETGKGAYLNGVKIQVSPQKDLGNCLIGFGTTPYEREKSRETFEKVEKVYLSCQDIRRSGSAALDLAYVACGRMDGFFEMRLQPWDYAAGDMILKEAGGTATDWSGNALSVVAPSGVIATNGAVHQALLNQLK